MATANGSNGQTAPVSNEKINTDIVTLTRFLTEEQGRHKEATGDFTSAPPSPQENPTDQIATNRPNTASSATPSNSPSNP